MTYTDNQLKSALAKMLPEKVFFQPVCQGDGWLLWNDPNVMLDDLKVVLDTELLHLCHLVEVALTDYQGEDYIDLLAEDGWSFKSTWQQRAVALCKVKGVEIV